MPSFGPSALPDSGVQGSAPAAAVPNMQSKLFGKATQYASRFFATCTFVTLVIHICNMLPRYAPEALGLAHLGLPQQYTHDSDLWAVGNCNHRSESQLS